MKKIKTVFLLGVLLFVLSACGNKITEGKVYEKEFIPAHSETVLVPMIIPCRKSVTTVMRPQTTRKPDTWYIKIESTEPEEDGNTKKSTYSVSEDIFNQYEVGDIYSHEH